MDYVLIMFPIFSFPAHHLLLKAVLQRLRMDHAQLLAVQPVFSISQTQSGFSGSFSPDFFTRYFRRTLGEPRRNSGLTSACAALDIKIWPGN